MSYELWDTETANLVGDYATEEDALTIVRRAIRTHGPEAVASLALAFEDEDGETHPIASGAALAKHVQPVSSGPNPARSRIAS